MQGEIDTYIKETWQALRRSPLDPAPDPKVDKDKALLYIPAGEDFARISRLVAARQPQNGTAGVEVRRLPPDPQQIQAHGVLYLPNDYFVPGGRFNEMYGWDSYWIVTGLLRDRQSQLAKGMVENFFYQIENYGGKILNANRTYYLSRSQPPLLGPMVQAVAAGLEGIERRAFLTRAAAALATNYTQFWKAQRFTEKTGLFHYGHPDQGALGMCAEVLHGERAEAAVGAPLSHYDRLANLLRDLPADDPKRQRFYDPATDGLTKAAIAGDRGMRESGFDPSMSLGYFGLETPDFNPVCLNVLLHVQCQALSAIHAELGEQQVAEAWGSEAQKIAGGIQRYNWNESTGLFTNYNHRAAQKSDFAFLTASYPLWAGLATPEQAQRFQDNLQKFETPHGIMTTPQQTGCQWDAPFMWAPLTCFAVDGLRRYGFDADAARIGQKYIDTVTRVFAAQGTIFEKYNAITGTQDTNNITVGYAENVRGFGWTNGVFTHVADWLQTHAPKMAARPAMPEGSGGEIACVKPK